MKKITRSILKELQSFVPEENKDSVIQSRASHIIESAINLFEQIDKFYTKDQAEELERRFFSSIKNKDSKRFERTIRLIKENKHVDKR